jgi:hypothetical protein
VHSSKGGTKQRACHEESGRLHDCDRCRLSELVLELLEGEYLTPLTELIVFTVQ